MIGGCLCGALRYRIDGPVRALHCHCRTCQRATGGAFATWVTVPAAAFHMIRGASGVYRSSDRSSRFFCTRCGSPILMIYEDDADVSVALGTLDDPAGIVPMRNIWASQRLPCARGFDAALPDHAFGGPD